MNFSAFTYSRFLCVLRRKFIVINSDLELYKQRQTYAHESRHALLHKGWGEHIFFSPGRFGA
ncbi:ImmA/IrrE family metallo-endopeptidase [Pelosinus baikalensis]|uniref:ImmA/IrrE family metallo-endopeptidase n=1 Tax=Pelosinus baikalensis TaxID=2892015 RepID=A0ABS8HMV5_9FIRM|nr:ImmA/IrrE family metallo-endopeptidase [Pelosinus baikalensis]